MVAEKIKTNNKTAKVLYRITTILLALFFVPGVFYLDSELAKEGMANVQAPVWLAQLLGYGQPLGALLVLIPGVWKRLKEWAYVALGIVCLGAFYAHLSIEGLTFMTFTPVIVLAVLMVSYLCWHKLNDAN